MESRMKDIPQIRTMENLSNVYAEESVIGGLLLANETDGATYALEVLRPDDFYFREQREIWKAICELVASNQPADLLTVSDWLTVNKVDISFSRLGEMAKNTPGQANIKRYTDIVKQNSVMRTARSKVHTAADILYGPGDFDEKMSKVLDELSQIGSDEPKDEIKNAGEVLDEVLDEMQSAYEAGGKVTGLKTGFENIDHWIPGMQPGDLVVIAARPSMGKTTLAMNIAENVAYLDEEINNVLVFSLEMSRKQLVKKSIVRFGSLYLSKINTGAALGDTHDVGRFSNALEVINKRKANFIIDDRPGLHITQIQARSKRMLMKLKKIGLIVVDYAQLVHSDGETRALRVGAVTKGLKALAKQIGCPVIVLSQLNRAIAGRPEMSNLKDSGSIEEDADIIMFLHDEDYEGDRGDHSLTEIIISKQRLGATGSTYLQPELAFSRFVDTKRLPEVKQEDKPAKAYKKRYDQ